MKPFIDVSPHHLRLIQKILHQHLPSHVTVWVFGSRAKKATKKFSDLDLLIDTDKPLSAKTMAKLRHDFTESLLPYKVDLIDSTTISDSFRDRINIDKVVIWKGSDPIDE